MADAHTRARSSWYIGAALLTLAALAVYWPALRGDFLWDDELDITGNRALRDAAWLWRIWFNPAGLYDYYPIKYTVQWLQWQLWAANPTGYHVTNVVLHAASAVLVWRVLQQLGVGTRAAFVAGLFFVVHPLAVESVAWITELKNTLSLPFLLLAFLFFLRFDARRHRRDYGLAFACFLAALLCKTSVVMFPVTLLLHAWWKRARIGVRDMQVAAPFFALSLGFGLVTLWFQHHRAIGGAEGNFDPVGGIGARVACAGSSLAFYAWKTLWPANLMPIYPQWPLQPWSFALLLPWLVLAALLAWFWRRRTTWGRHALFGAGWFVLHLLPVLGLVPISSQRFTWVMDHLAYVPMLGLIGLAAGSGDALAQHAGRTRRATLTAAIALGCAVLAIAAHRHAATFRDEETLWRHNVAHNPEAWMALYNLGTFAGKAGRAAEAIDYYRRALQVRPAYPEAWNNLGMELQNTGALMEAISAYETAIRLKPAHVAAHNNLATSLAALGRVDDAIGRCETALRLDPRFAPAHRNLGNILVAAGRPREGIARLERALQLQPNFPEAENDLGVALSAAGRPEEAITHLQRAVQQRLGYAAAHNNLGGTLSDVGRHAEGLPHVERALELQPRHAGAHYNHGRALLAMGRADAAGAAFRRALELNPAHADAHFMLGTLLAQAGRQAEALAAFEAALRARPDYAAAHRNAGIVLARMGRVAEAVPRYRQALRLKPDFADAHLSLAAALQQLGQMREAVAHYEAARKLRPELPPLP